MDLHNHTALITGASSGIGLSFAEILAEKGCRVILASRNIEKLNQIKTELETKYKTRIEVIQSDLSRENEAKKLYEAVHSASIPVDILINNAGVGLYGEAVERNEDEISKMLELNIISLTALCSLFGRDMKAAGKGMILNVGSLIGLFPAPGFAAYSASKSYVLNYSLAVREEMKKKGVSVTCLLPGFVRTNFDANTGISSGRYKEFSFKMGMTPEKTAKVGIRAMINKKAYLAAGFTNKIMLLISGIFPKTWIAALLNGILRNITA